MGICPVTRLKPSFNSRLITSGLLRQARFYRELQSLEKDGWVTSTLVAQKGKPDKKVFSITETGKEELKQVAEGRLSGLGAAYSAFDADVPLGASAPTRKTLHSSNESQITPPRFLVEVSWQLARWPLTQRKWVIQRRHCSGNLLSSTARCTRKCLEHGARSA